MASTSERERQSHLAAVAGAGDCHSVTRRFMRRWRHGLLVPFAALIACALLVGPAAAATKSAATSEGQPKLAFWMATSNNGIFDAQTLDFIADHANIVVLNAPLAGGDGAPSYAQVVAGLHARDPELPVLLYFWATRVYAGKTYGGVLRSGSVVSQNLPDLPNLLLKNPMNGRAMHQATISYGDVASPAYVHWLTSRVGNVLRVTGADGVASDVSLRQPFPQWCGKKPVFCKNYANGVDTLFSDLKSSIKPKLVMFNGLWANQPGRLEQQERLLGYTDGAVIEWFGRRQNKPIPPFEVGTLPYMKAIANHPGKRFMVFARGSIGYTSYQEDYLWQRYLYAAYLMIADQNTSFRYLSTFQSESPGRANMYTLYDDVAVKVGTPQGHYRLTGNLYSRTFSNGIALMVPAGGRSESYTLTGTLYRANGSPVAGNIEVEPGSGWVLFDQRPVPKPFKLSFAGQAQAKPALPVADVVVPSVGVPFLRMKALPAASTWQHDLMLDPVKTLSAPRALEIRLRTKDPTAKLLVVTEVDDSMEKADQAVIELDAGACQAKSQKNMRISFRASHSALGYLSQCVNHFLDADGAWHTYTVPIGGVLPSRLTVRRWEYLRFEGAIDVGYVATAR